MAKKSTKFDKKAKLKQRSGSRVALIVQIIAAIGGAVLLGYALLISVGGGTQSGGTQGGGSADRFGRFLPASYQEQSISNPVDYSQQQAVPMTDVKNSVADGSVEISLNDIKQNKFIFTAYEKKQVNFNGGTTGLPIMAYIKPSGKLFVAISFCPPCQGIRHTITPDGTLSCNTCGTKRDLETQKGISGACALYPPDELPVKIQGDKVLISEKVLNDWSPQQITQ